MEYCFGNIAFLCLILAQVVSRDFGTLLASGVILAVCTDAEHVHAVLSVSAAFVLFW